MCWHGDYDGLAVARGRLAAENSSVADGGECEPSSDYLQAATQRSRVRRWQSGPVVVEATPDMKPGSRLLHCLLGHPPFRRTRARRSSLARCRLVEPSRLCGPRSILHRSLPVSGDTGPHVAGSRRPAAADAPDKEMAPYPVREWARCERARSQVRRLVGFAVGSSAVVPEHDAA